MSPVWVDALELRLSNGEREAQKPRPRERRAAVLAAVLGLGTESPWLAVIRRSSYSPTHAGQYALPGGRIEDGEGAVAAALREAHEEVALEPASMRVLGELDDLRTPSGFVITPVVGVSEESPQLEPDGHEVIELLRLPLASLLEKQAFQSVRLARGGVLITSRAIVHEGKLIWGATARVLMALRRNLLAVGADR